MVTMWLPEVSAMLEDASLKVLWIAHRFVQKATFFLIEHPIDFFLFFTCGCALL